MTKKEKDAYLFAHLFFGLKKGDGLVLHHKDPTMRYNNPERYKQWNPEDLVVMTRAEHVKLHHTGISKKAWNKGKHNIYTDETKAKMREKKIGMFVGGNNPCARKVEQYDLHGELIRIWDALSDIQRELGIDRRKIGLACKGQRYKTYKGYIWKYKE
jgi:hypothetical protein